MTLDEFIAGAGPKAAEVEWSGRKMQMHFRPLTAGEREQVLAGQKVSAPKNGAREVEYEIDLGANQREKSLVVFYSCCDASGKPAFASVEKVRALDGRLVDVLYRHATGSVQAGDAGNS